MSTTAWIICLVVASAISYIAEYVTGLGESNEDNNFRP